MLTLWVALKITALLSLVLIVIVRWLDRAECASSRLYLWAVLSGILASTALAIPANQGILSAIARWSNLNHVVADYFGKKAALNIAPLIAGPDFVLVKIMLAGEQELIGYKVEVLPAASRLLQLSLWWRGLLPVAEDWAAFFHLTPLNNDRELLGRIDQAITAYAYPPTVW